MECLYGVGCKIIANCIPVTVIRAGYELVCKSPVN